MKISKFLLITSVLLISIPLSGCSSLQKTPVEKTPEKSQTTVTNESGSKTVETKTATPAPTTRSVTEYYYLLPSKYIGMEIGDSKAGRKAAAKIIDLENDYISVQNNDWEGSGAVAVFRTTGGEDLIAVSNAGCGPICDQNFYLLRYQNKTWIDVTKELFPKLDTEKTKAKLITLLKEKGEYNPDDFSLAPFIEIPRIGTTIRIYDQYSNITLAEIGWKKGKFVLQE